MPCDSPLKGFKDLYTGGLTFRRENAIGKMEVACGLCLGCRLDYSRMWAMRICHESAMWEFECGNCFITLTYRDKYDCTEEQWKKGYYVPDDWSLHPEHVTDFLKRLRHRFPQKIRYYYAGEYGRKCEHGISLDVVKCPMCFVGRPHYHMCLFNCVFPDLEAYQSNDGIMRYTSPMLEGLWRYGFVDVGELNYQSAAYTARYVTKKVVGARAADHYMKLDEYGVVTFLQPEYCRMSRGGRAGKGEKCGIGAKWFEEYEEDCFPSDEVPVPGYGVVKGVPRYYDEMLKEKNLELYEQIKKKRVEFLLENKEEFTDERRMSKHKCKKARAELFGKRHL